MAYQFNKRVLDEEAHFILTYWWNRLVPLRSYVHGCAIGPSHYSNRDLGMQHAAVRRRQARRGDRQVAQYRRRPRPAA